jgi:hypothetical protein
MTHSRVDVEHRDGFLCAAMAVLWDTERVMDGKSLSVTTGKPK